MPWYFSHEKHLCFLTSKKNLKVLGTFWEIWEVWSIIFFSLPELWFERKAFKTLWTLDLRQKVRANLPVLLSTFSPYEARTCAFQGCIIKSSLQKEDAALGRVNASSCLPVECQPAESLCKQERWCFRLAVSPSVPGHGHFVCMELVFKSCTEVMLVIFPFAWAGL